MYLTIDDITIYYEKYGSSKKTILILPGWGNTSQTFHNIISFFKTNYTIYIIDYPAFGKSPLPNRDLTIYDYATLIQKFLIKENIQNPIVIAHSFGGRITTVLTGLNKVEIDKLILIDIASIKPKKTLKRFLKEKTYKCLKKVIRLLPPLKQEVIHQKLLKYFASTDYNSLPPTMYRTFKNIVNEDLTKYLKNIDTEALIIWGEKDLDTPIKDAKKINKLIKNSTLITLKNATHYSYLQYPLLTNNIISCFISEEKD